MGTATGVITAVEAVFGLIVVLAAALAVARANYAKTQITALRGDVDDLSNRNQRLADELIIERSNLAAVQKELETERSKVSVLEKVITGRDKLEDISKTLTSLVGKTDEHQRKLLAETTAIRKELATARGGAD